MPRYVGLVAVQGLARATDWKGSAVPAARVEIYTKMFCGYCHRAKRLLDSKGVSYVEYDITMDGAKRDEMRARAPGARTVPQIFIDDRAVGGSDELATLERDGKLDGLLGI
jgi:glutaredoxin 3